LPETGLSYRSTAEILCSVLVATEPPYRDPTRPVDERVDDLLARMTLEEKAGLMFQPAIMIGPDGELADGSAETIADRHVNHFNIYFAPAARRLAEWHNRLQEIAAGTRLGIPVTISSDPRHGFDENPATSWSAGSFSQWPEPIGFGAIGDEEVVRRFGDIARREYRAVGIHVALHPMADIATEPRWARAGGTFGEDGALVGRLTAAYIRGFQGEELGPHSVACMTKHFPGGGPQADGEDPHFPYGKDQVYPGGRFEDHLKPFEEAFAAGTAQVMPYYGRPVGTELEEVGFGYNRQVVEGLLRGRYGFRRRRLHRLGARQRPADARRLDLGGEGLGRRAARRRRPAREDRRGGLRPARRRGPAGAARRARALRPDRGGAHRRVGAPHPARQVPARAVRRAVRRPGRGGAHLRRARVPGGG
jgi:hypothetical protein